MAAPLELGAPLDDTQAAIMDLTERKWLLWLPNFAENLPLARKGLDVGNIPKRTGPAIIVGAGPSLPLNYNLLGKNRERIKTLIASDRVLKPLISINAAPNIVSSVDGDPIVSHFYKLNADERGQKIDTVLNVVTVHPLTVKAVKENLGGNIYWYTHMFDDPLRPRCRECRRVSLTSAIHLMSQRTIMQTGGNVGAFCWHLAAILGCNPIIMVGMDMGYTDGTQIENTHYYDAYMKGHDKDYEKVKATCYQTRINPDFDKPYMIDVVFEVYRYLLMNSITRAYKEQKIQTINATGGGSLHGEGIIGMSLKQALETYY